MRYLTAALAALAFSILLPAGATAGTSQRSVQRALDRLVAARGGPPGAIATLRSGAHSSVVTSGVGNIRTGQAPRSFDTMRLASTAKAFSGAVSLSLVQHGRLSLDDTIGERLGGMPPQWARVTLRQLLAHTSGITSYPSTPAFQKFLGADPRRHVSVHQIIKFVAKLPLRFTPGTRYEYSNTDNILVALMSEAATGLSYDELLEGLVYRPLGLTGTFMPPGFTLPPGPLMRGYLVDPPKPPEDVTTAVSQSGAWASGGLASTPRDLNAFARGYVGGALFGAAVRRAQRSFRTGTSEPPGPGVNAAGLALFRYRTRCGTVFGHTGNTFGYTQFFAAGSDGTRSVTVSINRQLTPDADAPLFALLRRAEETAVCAALGR